MPRKGTTGLAALLVFGTASVVLANTNNRTGYHGLVAQRPVLMTMSNGRTGAVNDAARPFTTEEKSSFAAPQRIAGRTTAWIKLTEPGGKLIMGNVPVPSEFSGREHHGIVAAAVADAEPAVQWAAAVARRDLGALGGTFALGLAIREAASRTWSSSPALVASISSSMAPRLDADPAQPRLDLEGLARVLHREDRAATPITKCDRIALRHYDRHRDGR
jgi:hypothetical protein